MSTTKVVILGGGFAGVAAAKILAKDSTISTTLVDRSSFHIYHASLYEIVTEEISRETVAIPLHQIFAGTSVRVLREAVTFVNKDKRIVSLKGGQKLDYDHIVLALGAVSNDFDIPGVRKNALMFRELNETVLLRDNIRTLFHMNQEKGKKEINLVICGGGFSGIELACELRWHLNQLINKYHCDCVNLTILEGGSQLLPGMPAEVVNVTNARLKTLAIKTYLEDPVTLVEHDGVRLKSGKWVPSDLTIWTAGTKPNPLVDIMGLPLDEKGRPVVNENLQVLGRSEMWVAGDLAGYTDPATGRGIPPQAYNAIEMGRLVGTNIRRLLTHKSLQQFHYKPANFIIPIGHNDALLVNGGKLKSGNWPSFLKRLVEFRYLISLFGISRGWPIFWSEIKVMAEPF